MYTSNVFHLVKLSRHNNDHNIRSISLPSDLSLGDSLPHCSDNGLNIVQDDHKKRMNVRIQGIIFPCKPLLTITPSTDTSCTGKRPRHVTAISMLSDNVLLEIFDFCQKNHHSDLRFGPFPAPEAVWDWHILVHVCSRWRQVVFASPLRLNLQILCTFRTPVRRSLDIWPAFPLHIEYSYLNMRTDEDNIIAALEHPDRVSVLSLRLTGPQLKKVTTVMQEPFPALRFLGLRANMFNVDDIPVVSSEFLRRSAPRLQRIQLSRIPFPTLPALLLSTSNLVTLHLYYIPQVGYIPPEAMVAALATLTRLEDLRFDFRSPASRPDRIHLPPVTRSVLPALTSFSFGGVREYLEDFLARINAPRLHTIWINYFSQLVDFEVPHLCQFIEHSEDLNRRPMRCVVEFHDKAVDFGAGHGLTTPLYHVPNFPKLFNDFRRRIMICILCEGIDWQVSHIAQALNRLSPVLSNMHHLAIGYDSISPKPEDMDDIEWLQLLLPFSSVQMLFVSRAFSGHVSRSLNDIPGVMATEVLPALDVLCLEGQPVSAVRKFITARSEFGLPVTTIDTRRAFDERLGRT